MQIDSARSRKVQKEAPR